MANATLSKVRKNACFEVFVHPAGEALFAYFVALLAYMIAGCRLPVPHPPLNGMGVLGRMGWASWAALGASELRLTSRRVLGAFWRRLEADLGRPGESQKPF